MPGRYEDRLSRFVGSKLTLGSIRVPPGALSPVTVADAPECSTQSTAEADLLSCAASRGEAAETLTACLLSHRFAS